MGTKGNKGTYPNYFNDEGIYLRDPRQIADGFNNFFATIGNHLADQISPGNFGYNDFLGQPHSKQFKFKQIFVEDTIKIIQSPKP